MPSDFLPPGYFTAAVIQTDPLIAGAIASELTRQQDVIDPVSNRQTTFKRPDHQHHRDFSPVVPLADDCLLADTRLAV